MAIAQTVWAFATLAVRDSELLEVVQPAAEEAATVDAFSDCEVATCMDPVL